jgi:negative regulator of sigma E activity
MLPERVTQLLTAYIDGELNARQRQAVERLLGESAEARTLYEQLRHDADVLRQLPRRKLGEDFSQRVLRSISERLTHAASARTLAAPGNGVRAGQGRGGRFADRAVYPMWIGVAAVAAMLLVAVLTSFLYYQAARQPKQESMPVAKNESVPPQKAPDAKSTAERKDAAKLSSKEATKPPSVAAKSQEPEEPAETNDEEKSATVKGPPPLDFVADADPSVDATPTPRLEVFKRLDELKLSAALPLRNLNQSDQEERLRGLFRQEGASHAFHLDVMCSETGRGLERLEAAFKSQGIKLLVDQAAEIRWKNGFKTNYAIYSEDVTAEELTKVLQLLGKEEKKAEPKRRFDRVVIHQLTPSNQKQLCRLLGVDPKALPAKAEAPLGVDIRKPLSESTAEQVADSLAGKGTPRPKPGEPVQVKKPERLALVLSYNPLRVRPDRSKEIKSFLDSRKDRRAGTLQILMVLRGS